MTVHRARDKRKVPPRSRKQGFSLVELLVVLSVLIVLIAVVAPATLQARNRARSIACLTNLKQLASAVSAYGQDWDDRLPALRGMSCAGGASRPGWPKGSSATMFRDATWSYVRNSGVYRCANDFGAADYGFDPSEGSVFNGTGCSYLPWSGIRSGAHGVRMNGVKSSTLAPASRFVLLRDYGRDWHGYRTRSGMEVEAVNVVHAAYADGHAAPLFVVEISASDRTYACWTGGVAQDGEMVFISGGSGDVHAELSGKRTYGDFGSGIVQMRLSLSGVISVAGTEYNVDRVFAFGPEIKLDPALRQVVAWIEGFAS
jgi:prepilin-type N-terminal cleavage/methylation domain-containing protein